MKKFFLLVSLVSAFSLVSCKKDRVCTCTETKTSGGVTVTTTSTTTYTDSRKGDARLLCQGNATSTTASNGDKDETRCDLK